MKETAENLAGNTLTEFDKAYQFVTKAIITVRRKSVCRAGCDVSMFCQGTWPAQSSSGPFT